MMSFLGIKKLGDYTFFVYYYLLNLNFFSFKIR